MEEIKCVLIGDKKVGKSSLLLGYKNLATDFEAPKILDAYTCTVAVDSVSYQLRVYNTSGQEYFDRLMPLNYPRTDVFLICFAIDSLDSFNSVETKWFRQVQQHEPDVPIVLVGTKADLRDEETLVKSRLITTREGSKLGRKIKAAIYIECSAFTQMNLSNVFDEAVRATCKHQEKIPRSCYFL